MTRGPVSSLFSRHLRTCYARWLGARRQTTLTATWKLEQRSVALIQETFFHNALNSSHEFLSLAVAKAKLHYFSTERIK